MASKIIEKITVVLKEVRLLSFVLDKCHEQRQSRWILCTEMSGSFGAILRRLKNKKIVRCLALHSQYLR